MESIDQVEADRMARDRARARRYAHDVKLAPHTASPAARLLDDTVYMEQSGSRPGSSASARPKSGPDLFGGTGLDFQGVTQIMDAQRERKRKAALRAAGPQPLPQIEEPPEEPPPEPPPPEPAPEEPPPEPEPTPPPLGILGSMQAWWNVRAGRLDARAAEYVAHGERRRIEDALIEIARENGLEVPLQLAKRAGRLERNQKLAARAEETSKVVPAAAEAEEAAPAAAEAVPAAAEAVPASNGEEAAPAAAEAVPAAAEAVPAAKAEEAAPAVPEAVPATEAAEPAPVAAETVPAAEGEEAAAAPKEAPIGEGTPAGGPLTAPLAAENEAAVQAEAEAEGITVTWVDPGTMLVFTPEQVLEAYRRSRPKGSMLWQASLGRLSWTKVALHYTLRALLVVLILLFLHWLLVMAVFSSSDLSVDEAEEGSGGGSILVDPEYGGAAATSQIVGLRSLWDFPALHPQELQQVQDVVFVHNLVHHTLRVASLARTSNGVTMVHAADGSAIRIERGGNAFWRQVFQGAYAPEVRLSNATYGARQTQSWITSSLVGTDIVVADDGRRLPLPEAEET